MLLMLALASTADAAVGALPLSLDTRMVAFILPGPAPADDAEK